MKKEGARTEVIRYWMEKSNEALQSSRSEQKRRDKGIKV